MKEKKMDKDNRKYKENSKDRIKYFSISFKQRNTNLRYRDSHRRYLFKKNKLFEKYKEKYFSNFSDRDSYRKFYRV